MDNLEIKTLAEFVKRCGFEEYPNEACGFVCRGKNDRPIFIKCKNASLEPKHNFLIAPKEQIEVEKQGEIVACWHTHCNVDPKASTADKQGAKNTQVPWFIGSVFGNEKPELFKGLELVEVDDDYETPLLNRPYAFGVFDCFSLMRDYYKRELHIELPELPREERVWASEPNYMAKQAVENFDLVKMPPNSKVMIGDLFFIQTGADGADHIAIYVGSDRILHQMRNRLSKTDIYGGSYWQEHTISHWRHKSKC